MGASETKGELPPLSEAEQYNVAERTLEATSAALEAGMALKDSTDKALQAMQADAKQMIAKIRENPNLKTEDFEDGREYEDLNRGIEIFRQLINESLVGIMKKQPEEVVLRIFTEIEQYFFGVQQWILHWKGYLFTKEVNSGEALKGEKLMLMKRLCNLVKEMGTLDTSMQETEAYHWIHKQICLPIGISLNAKDKVEKAEENIMTYGQQMVLKVRDFYRAVKETGFAVVGFWKRNKDRTIGKFATFVWKHRIMVGWVLIFLGRLAINTYFGLANEGILLFSATICAVATTPVLHGLLTGYFAHHLTSRIMSDNFHGFPLAMGIDRAIFSLLTGPAYYFDKGVDKVTGLFTEKNLHLGTYIVHSLVKKMISWIILGYCEAQKTGIMVLEIVGGTIGEAVEIVRNNGMTMKSFELLWNMLPVDGAKRLILWILNFLFGDIIAFGTSVKNMATSGIQKTGQAISTGIQNTGEFVSSVKQGIFESLPAPSQKSSYMHWFWLNFNEELPDLSNTFNVEGAKALGGGFTFATHPNPQFFYSTAPHLDPKTFSVWRKLMINAHTLMSSLHLWWIWVFKSIAEFFKPYIQSIADTVTANGEYIQKTGEKLMQEWIYGPWKAYLEVLDTIIWIAMMAKEWIVVRNVDWDPGSPLIDQKELAQIHKEQEKEKKLAAEKLQNETRLSEVRNEQKFILEEVQQLKNNQKNLKKQMADAFRVVEDLKEKIHGKKGEDNPLPSSAQKILVEFVTGVMLNGEVLSFDVTPQIITDLEDFVVNEIERFESLAGEEGFSSGDIEELKSNILYRKMQWWADFEPRKYLKEAKDLLISHQRVIRENPALYDLLTNIITRLTQRTDEFLTARVINGFHEIFIDFVIKPIEAGVPLDTNNLMSKLNQYNSFLRLEAGTKEKKTPPQIPPKPQQPPVPPKNPIEKKVNEVADIVEKEIQTLPASDRLTWTQRYAELRELYRVGKDNATETGSMLVSLAVSLGSVLKYIGKKAVEVFPTSEAEQYFPTIPGETITDGDLQRLTHLGKKLFELPSSGERREFAERLQDFGRSIRKGEVSAGEYRKAVPILENDFEALAARVPKFQVWAEDIDIDRLYTAQKPTIDWGGNPVGQTATNDMQEVYYDFYEWINQNVSDFGLREAVFKSLEDRRLEYINSKITAEEFTRRVEDAKRRLFDLEIQKNPKAALPLPPLIPTQVTYTTNEIATPDITTQEIVFKDFRDWIEMIPDPHAKTEILANFEKLKKDYVHDRVTMAEVKTRLETAKRRYSPMFNITLPTSNNSQQKYKFNQTLADMTPTPPSKPKLPSDFEEYGEQLGILLNTGASPTNPQGSILTDPILVDAYKQMYGLFWQQEMKKLHYGRGRLMSTQIPQGVHDILKEKFTGSTSSLLDPVEAKFKQMEDLISNMSPRDKTMYSQELSAQRFDYHQNPKNQDEAFAIAEGTVAKMIERIRNVREEDSSGETGSFSVVESTPTPSRTGNKKRGKYLYTGGRSNQRCRVAKSNCHRDKRSKGMEAPDMLLWFEDFQIPPSNTLSADQTRELAKRKFSEGKVLCAHDVKDTEKLYVGRRLKLSKEYLENWNRKVPHYPKDVHSWSKPSVWQVRDSSATLRGEIKNGETWLQEYIQRKRWVDVKKVYSGNEMDSEGRVVTEIDIPVTDNKSVLKNVTLMPHPFQDDKRVVVAAIVDTGAEVNEISYEVAKRLGLYDQQNKIGTEILLSNTNSYKTFEANIWIHIDRKSLKDKLHDQETVNNPHIMENLTVVFPQQEMESSVELLIGRTGIKELRFVIRTV